MPPLPLNDFVERVKQRGENVDEVIAQFVDAGRRAAVRVFGTGPKLEVTYKPEWPGTIEVLDICDVVENVSNPAREISLAAAHRANFDAVVGDGLMLPIKHGPDDWERALAKPLPFPVPAFSSELGEAIFAELVAVFASRGVGVAAPWGEGTIGHALASSAGWLAGYTQDGLTIERTFLHLYRGDLDHAFAAPSLYWGFHLRAGNERVMRYVTRPCFGAALHAPFATSPSEPFRAAFGKLAAELRADAGPRKIASSDAEAWLQVLARRADASSLLGWCEQQIPTLLGRFSHTTSHGGQEVTCRAVGVEAEGAEQPWIVRLETNPAQPDDRVVLPIGQLSMRAYATPAPTGERLQAILGLVETFHEFWREPVDPGGPPRIMEYGEVRRDRNILELLQVVESYATNGPPPAPPVPVSALARSGPPLRKADKSELELVRTLAPRLKCFAAFKVDDYLIGLADDKEMVFGAPWIAIVDLRDRGVVELLDSDPQAEATWVIDGDAYAYACFAQWLGAAIVDAALDRSIKFSSDDESVSLRISEWLLMRWQGPKNNPRFVDWRVQSTQVVRGRIGEFNTPDAEIARYRRFLREMIHPALG